MIGTLQEKGQIKIAKTGTMSSKGITQRWALWTQLLKINGLDYSIAGFEKNKIEELTSSLKIGVQIQFEFKQRGVFRNIVVEDGIKQLPSVASSATGPLSIQERLRQVHQELEQIITEIREKEALK